MIDISVVENNSQTSNDLAPVLNSNQVKQKNESTNLSNKKNGHTVDFVEFAEDKQNEQQKTIKVPNGTSTSVQVTSSIKNTCNQNVVEVEIRDNDKLKKSTLPETNGNGEVNGKHVSNSTISNSINHNGTSKKRERDTSDDSNTTKKRKEFEIPKTKPAIIMKNGNLNKKKNSK